MAQKMYYVGSHGPFYYDDSDVYNDAHPLINHQGIYTEGKMRADGAPTNDEDVVRLEDVNSRLISPIPVVDIDDPSAELVLYGGDAGSVIVCYEVEADANQITVYEWDSACAAGINIPYVVAGSSGFWIAVAGKYTNSEVKLGNDLTIGNGATGVDYKLTFDGETNDGIIEWMEDEDYFKFSDDILMDGGTQIFFRDSNGWIYSGGANLISIVVQDLQLYSNAIDLGRNGVDADTILKFMSSTNDGVVTWKNTEDYLQFSDDILIELAEKIFFRDTALSISSVDDGYIDYDADTGHRFSGPSVRINGDLYIGQDADADTAIVFTGDTNDGQITYKEDEDIFEIGSGFSNTPDEITATSDGVAASLTTINTEVTTNGDADLDNVTLANGTSGQVKNIYCVVLGNVGDTWKITPANMVGGSQITFTGVGQGCTLSYADNEGWVVTGNNGGTIT